MSMAQPPCTEGVYGESMALELWATVLQAPTPLHRAAVQQLPLPSGRASSRAPRPCCPTSLKGTKSSGVILSSLPMAVLKGPCLLRVNN